MTQQGILLGQHSTQLTAASREVDQLTAQVAELNVRVQELQQEALASRSAASFVRSPPQAEPEPHANSPPPYDGDPNSCRAFLSQCSLVFALQPRRYVMEESQVAFVITLLKGRARDWATAMWDARAPFCATFQDFRAEMIKLFDRSAQGDEAASQLVRLNQDGRSRTIPSSLEHWRPPATGMKLLCALGFGRGWMMRSRTRLLLTSYLVILIPSWNWLCV